MRNGLKDLEAALRQFRLHELGKTRSKQAILVHEDHGLCRLAGAVVQLDEVIERKSGHDAESGCETERVLETPLHDRVADADVDNVGEVVAGGSLSGREADWARKAADDGRDAIGLHLLDLLGACLRVRTSIAEHHLKLGTAKPFEAA